MQTITGVFLVTLFIIYWFLIFCLRNQRALTGAEVEKLHPELGPAKSKYTLIKWIIFLAFVAFFWVTSRMYRQLDSLIFLVLLGPVVLNLYDGLFALYTGLYPVVVNVHLLRHHRHQTRFIYNEDGITRWVAQAQIGFAFLEMIAIWIVLVLAPIK